MRKLLYFSLCLFLFGSISSVDATAQPGPRIVSPEIHKDHTVTFRYEAPDAEKVELSAEFLKDSKTLSKDEDGIWSITTGPVEPDIYPYFFIVDGVAVADKSNPEIFPNERFKRSLVDIPGDSALMHSLQDVPHGEISFRYYKSESLDLVRPAVIYTPPGYDENRDTKYPVLYLIHGMTDTEETWFKVGRINLIMDNLIAMGKAEPMIIVMPYANPYPALLKRDKDTEVNLLDTDIFRKEILEEVIPYTESNYRVLINAGNRGIAGFSLGGRQALAAGLAHPEKFSWVAAFAPAVFEREFDDKFKNLYTSPEEINNNLELLWISCGREDGLFDNSEAFISRLNDKGIHYKLLFTDGGHTWMNVRDYIAETAQLLFK
jgi:enterochelin esterase family protein